jgi:hypothetical protein
VIAGDSAGEHLAPFARLTANDPTNQPGFEHADTTVTAVVGLGGYYGPPRRRPSRDLRSLRAKFSAGDVGIVTRQRRRLPCGERFDGGGDGRAAEGLEVVEGVLG